MANRGWCNAGNEPDDFLLAMSQFGPTESNHLRLRSRGLNSNKNYNV